MKKVLALVLALAMVLSLSTAFAATITVSNANEDESYDVYKIFDAVINGSAVSYTINSSSPVWDLVKGTQNETTGVWTNSTYGLAFTPTVSNASVYVVDGSAMTDAKAADLAAYLKTNIASISTAKVGTIDKITTSLTTGEGYYFVDSTMGSLCALATEDTAQEIREKNTPPSLEKKDSDAADGPWGKTTDVQIGDTVYFQLTITDGTGTDKELILTDTMPDSLTFDPDDNDITVAATGITDSDYAITYPTGVSFQINFTPTFMASLDASDTIVVTFSAILNEKAVVGTATENEAEITYSNQHDTDTADVNTHKVELLKYDGADSNKAPLAGAIFELRNNGTVVKLVKESANTYHVATAAEIAAASTVKAYTGVAADDAEINTDDVVSNFITVDGSNIVIEGVDDSVTTYAFVETKAPLGFNPLTEAKTFTAAADNTTVVEAENNSGTTLPSTGGIGTTIFYVSGLIMVLGASIILISRRRADAK